MIEGFRASVTNTDSRLTGGDIRQMRDVTQSVCFRLLCSHYSPSWCFCGHQSYSRQSKSAENPGSLHGLRTSLLGSFARTLEGYVLGSRLTEGKLGDEEVDVSISRVANTYYESMSLEAQSTKVHSTCMLFCAANKTKNRRTFRLLSHFSITYSLGHKLPNISVRVFRSPNFFLSVPFYGSHLCKYEVW